MGEVGGGRGGGAVAYSLPPVATAPASAPASAILKSLTILPTPPSLSCERGGEGGQQGRRRKRRLVDWLVH